VIRQFFLVIEGDGEGYPNYETARVSLQIDDPSTINLKNIFTCSPLFSLYKSGVRILPEIKIGTRIDFYIISSPFPIFAKLLNNFNITNHAWFSLGLANLVIITNDSDGELANEIGSYLETNKGYIATEKWIIKDKGINTTLNEVKLNTIHHETFKLRAELPLSSQFILSELIITVEEILSSCKKYTPHYYEDFQAIFNAGTDLINDLYFLDGDEHQQHSGAFDNSITSAERDQWKSDRLGRLVQFSSALSYVYSQIYSGSFPVLDHVGIIRRHSLLGIGTANGALFQLLLQLEKAFLYIPFENIIASQYNTAFIPTEFFKSFSPDKHLIHIWESDQTRKVIFGSSDPESHKHINKETEFFSRFPFFSGRLGFREYDLSATAALQVLVEASSLEWNVINYTHEIIHNHVRIILEPLIQPYESDSQLKKWLSNQLQGVTKCYKNNRSINLSYSEYFSYLLISYCINSEYFGGLSIKHNRESYLKMIASGSNERNYQLPNIDQLIIRLRSLYRDISEIFVHVLDFSYVYIHNLDVYIKSIWCSWSRVPTVLSNVEHYILRTLLIFALKEQGTSYDRFDESVKRFKEFLTKHDHEGSINCISQQIHEILDNSNEDLKQRFVNSIVIADMAAQFFVAKAESYLNNEDERVLPKPDPEHFQSGFNNPIYELDTGEFIDASVRSKIRFVYDQLNRTIERNTNSTLDEPTEYNSAWLLLTLSSIHND